MSILNENFSSVTIPSLPVGWTASIPTVASSTWVSNAANASTGYTGASGGNKMVVPETSHFFAKWKFVIIHFINPPSFHFDGSLCFLFE